MKNSDSKTDIEYWNNNWQTDQTAAILSEEQAFFGRNGYFLKLMDKLFPNIQGSNILELGGGGDNYRLLALAKWREVKVTAVDFSTQGLNRLQELFDQHKCKLNIIEGDLFTIKSNKNHDIVLGFGLLEHFVNPVAILKVAAQQLLPAGKIFFSMPNQRALAASLWKRWSPENWSRHIEHSENLLQESFAQAGFEVTNMFYHGSLAVQMAAWENKNFCTNAITLLQRGSNLLGKVIPVNGMGSKYFSQEFGVLAQKKSDNFSQ